MLLGQPEPGIEVLRIGGESPVVCVPLHPRLAQLGVTTGQQIADARLELGPQTVNRLERDQELPRFAIISRIRIIVSR